MYKMNSICKICLIIILFFISLAGCDMGMRGVGISELSTSIDPRNTSRLPSFGNEILDCYSDLKELSDDIDSMAVGFALSIIESENFPDYYNNINYTFDLEVMDDSGSESGYGTNNQVDGVEEVDIVQSDGRYIYIAAGSDLVSIDTDGNIIDQVSLFQDGNISGLFLREDRILAVKECLYSNYWCCDIYSNGDESGQMTELVILSTGTDGKLTILESQNLAGNYVNARMVNGNVFLSTIQDFNLINIIYNITDSLPQDDRLSREELQNAAKKQLETAIPKWRNRLISSVFGQDVDMDAVRNTVRLYNLATGSTSEEILPFYDSFDSYLNIYTFNIGDGFNNVERNGSFSTANSWETTMYSDGNYIVIANDGWNRSESGWHENVYLLVYRNTNGMVAPLALGQTNGHTLNQFSLDIYDDYLRIATTQWSRWSWNSEGWFQEAESESFVSILDLHSSDNNLNRIGYLDGLGLGERLFAVRFMGDRGYLVTFEQIDPFYTLDLSNPSNPLVGGELEIPGFSRYLHPMDQDHILAIGQDNGLQVAVFDVGNMNNPSQLHKYVFTGNTYSAAEWDHHAFRYISSEEVLVIPQYEYNWGTGSSNSFSVLNLSSAGGIEERGRIEYPQILNYHETWISSPRSLLIEDTIITMRGQRIQGNNVTDLSLLWGIDL